MRIKFLSRSRYQLAIATLFAASIVFGQQAAKPANSSSPDDQYVPGPDSVARAGVPQGKTFEFTFDHSRVFPGTTRTITVYIPAAYRADKPACVYVGLDGLGFRAPTVFDNLIFKHEMPITIAIGVPPGTVESTIPDIVAPSPTAATPSDIDGDWQATLDDGEDRTRILLHITNTDGGLIATMDMPDEHRNGIHVTGIARSNNSFEFEVKELSGTFSGFISPDRSALVGTMRTDQAWPVTFKHVLDVRELEPRPYQDPRFNRSFEFDGLNDNLARFLLQEILPDVERHQTPDGLPILLSENPNDRAVGGASTGGIASFTLAWQRPDAFRRVFVAIGTFVGMRGGDRYPVLVRKTEPKPIRIFMQDGSNDQLTSFIGEAGDWWLGNQTMKSALEFAGYQVQHIWGEGTHDGHHATAVFPDAMRWLWKDWPQPVKAGPSQNTFLEAILLPNEDWQPVPGDYRSTGALAADPRGNIVFEDVSARRSWKIDGDGRLIPYNASGNGYSAIAFGPDGEAIVADPASSSLVALRGDGSRSTVAREIRAEHLIVTHNGSIYLTEPGTASENSGKVWLVKANGEKLMLDSGLHHPAGIALSPDQRWLAVAENKTHWGYSYRVLPDGSVQDKQKFYWFHVPDEADNSGAGAWCMDREGRLYAATRMGVQVFDRNGRVRAILPVPGGQITALSFGGADFKTLYVSSTDHKIYKRILRVPGVAPGASPIEPPFLSPG